MPLVASTTEVIKILARMSNSSFGDLADLCKYSSISSFARSKRGWIRATALSIVFAGAGGMSYAGLLYIETKRPLPDPAARANPNSTSQIDPRSTPFSQLPKHLEILIFDATSQKDIGARFANCLKLAGGSGTVDYQKHWKNEWEMKITRIYYQG